MVFRALQDMRHTAHNTAFAISVQRIGSRCAKLILRPNGHVENQQLGNSSPRFIRSCTYAIPNTYDLAVTCEVPLSIVLQPLAHQRPEELPVAIVDFGPTGPPRCETCRTYMNPWCIWTMGGQRWICNICGKESQGGYHERVLLVCA